MWSQGIECPLVAVEEEEALLAVGPFSEGFGPEGADADRLSMARLGDVWGKRARCCGHRDLVVVGTERVDCVKGGQGRLGRSSEKCAGREPQLQ